MFAHTWRMLPFLMLALVLAGCPNVILNPGQFLSASPSGPTRDGGFGPYPTESPADDVTDGESDGESREVVEPDVIRQVGNTLFILNQYRGLSIVDLDSETLLSQTGTPGYPRDLYVVGDRVYVIVAQYSNIVYAEDAIAVGSVGSMLYVIDIADLAAPEILSEFELEGDLIDSRLVGDVLYAIGARYTYYYPGGGGDVPVDAVEGSPGSKQTSASWVNSINLSNPADVHIVDQLSFDGYGSVIQATSSAIFVAGHDWESDSSDITYIDIADPTGGITVRGTVNVPGHVTDRFKMDAWNGTLRVVSNTGWPTRQTFVSTVPLADPDNLAVLGQTTIPAADNETLFATRFDGPVAYAVTYLLVDPLFVLDLSDPANPQVSGELIVPGWSTHIEPRGDRLVALGVDDTGGGRRVSVSLFDVADPYAPALLDRETFGDDWSWSTAYSDVKAFTVLDDTIIVPFSGWNEQGGYDRLQFISHDEDNLQARGHVDLRGQAVRSFEHAGHFYGVTQEQLAIIDGANLDAPEVVGSITLAENVADFLPLSIEGGTGVAVIRNYSNNAILLRAMDGEDTTVSEIELDGSYGGQVLGGASTVAVVSTLWEANQVLTIVQSVNYADPEAPVLNEAVRLALRPSYYWWWGYPYGGGVEPAVDRGVAFDALPYPYYNVPDAVVVGDRLVIAGDRATDPNATSPNLALAVVELQEGVSEGITEVDYDYLDGMFVSGNSVVLGSLEDAGQNLLGQYFTRHYAALFNPSTGVLGERANVPGRPVSFEDGVLVLEDWQYGSGFNVQRQMRTATWDGVANVVAVDSVNLSDSFGALIVSGANAYLPRWNNGFEVTGFGIANDGEVSTLDVLRLGNYGNLLAADGDTLYVHANGASLDRYVNPTEWEPLDSTPLQQWPYVVRFGIDTAYLPLGYSGLLVLPR